MRCSLLTGLFIATCGLTPVLEAVPQPSVTPRSWELTLRFQDPQRVSVFLPGKSQPAVYWYMHYFIENDTDRDVDFYPEIDLVTDTLKVVHSELNVSPEAFKAIQRRANDPLLLQPEECVGRLLRGKDQTRHAVAIWRDFDPKAKAFTIYVSGLSGEILRIQNPAFDPSKPLSDTHQRYFTLRKTLAIPYKLPGSVGLRNKGVPMRVPGQQKWIMR